MSAPRKPSDPRQRDATPTTNAPSRGTHADVFGDEDDDGFVDRLAAGRPTAADAERIQKAFRAYRRTDGGIKLERALQLPTTTVARRRFKRDRALVVALTQVGAAAGTVNAIMTRLSAEWQAFLGHEWVCWCHLPQPPAHASMLHAALFDATRLQRKNPTALSVKQLQRILGHRLKTECPTAGTTITPLATAPMEQQPQMSSSENRLPPREAVEGNALADPTSAFVDAMRGQLDRQPAERERFYEHSRRMAHQAAQVDELATRASAVTRAFVDAHRHVLLLQDDVLEIERALLRRLGR